MGKVIHFKDKGLPPENLITAKPFEFRLQIGKAGISFKC